MIELRGARHIPLVMEYLAVLNQFDRNTLKDASRLVDLNNFYYIHDLIVGFMEYADRNLQITKPSPRCEN